MSQDLTRYQAEYRRITAGRESEKSGAEAELEGFLKDFLHSAYSSLEAHGASSSDPCPPLHVYAADHPTESRTVAMDDQGLHVGIEFLQELDFALILYSNFLLQNFIWQVSPVMGDVPSLRELVEPADFPDQALTMHAESLMPNIVTRDGYKRRPASSLMEAMDKGFFAKEGESIALALSRSIDKPLFDFPSYLADADYEELLAAYLGEFGEYLLSLHIRLLGDAMHFLLAHELAHHELGHHLAPPDDAAQAKREEADADLRALAILGSVPGFHLRSLLTMFAFCHAIEPDVEPDRMEHPFARNRILILNDAVLQTRYDEGLRADINAGMALMATPLPTLQVGFAWDGGPPEIVEISVSHYSDLDQCVHIQLVLDRPPHYGEVFDGSRENAFLLSRLAFEAEVVLRNRIDPSEVLRRGRVVIRPGAVDGMLARYSTDSARTRTDIRIACPTEWWLATPKTEVAVESIDVEFLPEEDLESEEPLLMHRYEFHLDPVDIDYDDFLRSLPPKDEAPYAWANVQVAARRFLELSQSNGALFFYRHLRENCPDLMQYPDLIGFAWTLVQEGHLGEAAEVSRSAICAAPQLRPGFSQVLAFEAYQRGSLLEALDHVFLELCGIGGLGEYSEAASGLYAQILQGAEDPTLVALREFHSHWDALAERGDPSDPSQVLAAAQMALGSILEAQRAADRELLLLRQFEGEAREEIAAVSGGGYGEAREAFRAALDLETRFAPARVELARIALREDDPQEASRHWHDAHTLARGHPMVTALRGQIEAPNQGFQIRSRPVTEAFGHDGESGPHDSQD
ncbi:MAG: hypothetical protein GY725_03440 [bacterium]|nr:hypothetical protein [bacterium]